MKCFILIKNFINVDKRGNTPLQNFRSYTTSHRADVFLIFPHHQFRGSEVLFKVMPCGVEWHPNEPLGYFNQEFPFLPNPHKRQ
ncbi:hypothetical protein CEXT_192271 [Caerostris extrusa]|uniref:Uncharacterized protein n=1 Tax=Caerostris extrusa TaxID=172846 RepID=A0AAV4W4W8_CAEEX|nr:hypothetical protein CEXT_192271 [Caerostris extrusa]